MLQSANTLTVVDARVACMVMSWGAIRTMKAGEDQVEEKAQGKEGLEEVMEEERMRRG